MTLSMLLYALMVCSLVAVTGLLVVDGAPQPRRAFARARVRALRSRAHAERWIGSPSTFARVAVARSSFVVAERGAGPPGAGPDLPDGPIGPPVEPQRLPVELRERLRAQRLDLDELQDLALLAALARGDADVPDPVGVVLELVAVPGIERVVLVDDEDVLEAADRDAVLRLVPERPSPCRRSRSSARCPACRRASRAAGRRASGCRPGRPGARTARSTARRRTSRPAAYSSGYSPKFQTLPSSSCAKNVISASSSLSRLMSRSNSTTASTPSIFFVSPVTVKITRCGRCPRPRLERPSKTNCVPGTSGCHRLSTCVGAEKLPFGSKSFSVTVRLSGSACAAASFAPSAPHAPRVRAASSSAAIDVRGMRISPS